MILGEDLLSALGSDIKFLKHTFIGCTGKQ